MTDLEKWAVFLRFADIPAYRETVNRVIASKEAFQMAGNLLLSVSQSERERAIFRSRRMFQSDLESNIATAEARGEARKAHDVARKMVAEGIPVETIVRCTGVAAADVDLCTTNSPPAPS